MNATGLASLARQRVDGRGEIALRFRDGRTRMCRLYQEGAARIRMPEVAGDPLEAILINMAGGLTGGDRLAWDVELDEGTSGTITTQACERVHRSAGGEARITSRLRIATGARLAWLPQETIVFDRSSLTRRLEVDIAEGAEALLVEATIFGRRAMGEQVRQARFSDRWRVRYAGRLVHAEEFLVGPDAANDLVARPVLDGGTAIATVMMVSGRDECPVDPVRKIVGDGGGVSFWQVGSAFKLLVRLHGADGYGLRKRLSPLLALLNGKAGLPKVWAL